jgi:hypothetical protein
VVHKEEGMTFLTLKDMLLTGFSLSSAFAYDARREPNLHYVLSAAVIVVTWEAIGWNGVFSVVATSVSIAGMLAAMLHRRLTGRPLWARQSTFPQKDFLISLGLFTFWMAVTVIVGVLTS